MGRIFIVSVAMLALTAFATAGHVYCKDELGGPFEKTIGGKVISVDAQNSQIVVKTFENFNFSVPSDAKITNQDGLDVQLKDISVGNYVTVDYHDSSGSHIATDIEVDYSR